MTDRDLVDPELLGLLDQEQWLGLDAASLPAARKALHMGIAQAPPPAIAPHLVEIPGTVGAPPIGLRIFRPHPRGDGLRPAVYEIHGGGFVMGAAAMSDAANARRAMLHDIVVVSVDYRLAPETPFPGPLDDCHAGLAWVCANAAALGIDPARIVVAGESAGGGLAAALAILLRDRGDPMPAGLYLIYPMLDCRTGSRDEPNPDPRIGTFRWDRASNCFGWAAMHGQAVIPAERIGHFSAALAADLRGLPPSFIAVGDIDLFLHEDARFDAALSSAGVPVQLCVYAGAFHGFDLASGAAVARRFRIDADRALTRLLAGRDQAQ